MRILLFSFLIFTQFSFSQSSVAPPKESVLAGVVFDSITGTPLEFVSIRVFSIKDSSVVTGALTNEMGLFNLKKINVSKVYLVLSFVGYESKSIHTLSEINVETLLDLKIGLRPSSFQDLGEVKVVGKREVLETGIDKKVYSVADDMNTQGGTASDVLNNVPSIEVDQDGNISLRGDGNVIILIDGRPSTLTLNNGLSGLPANSVERVEVVTNPSAKYDPDGTSGIINIVLKKSKLRGVNGSISATGGTGYSFNGTASFNARTGKYNIFGNYSNAYSTGYRNFFSTVDRITDAGITSLEQDRPGSHLRRNQNLRLGMDYALKDNHTIGFSVNGTLGYQNRDGELDNRFIDVNGNMESQYMRSSSDISNDENLDLNVNYTGQFKKKGKLSANFTSSFEKEAKDGNYANDYLLDNYLVSNQLDLKQRVINNENNRVSTGQLDYEKVIENLGARIEFGAKMILRNEELVSYSETFDNVSNSYLADTLANFNYKYNEEIYALYGIWGQKVNRWKYQVGVRGEYAKQVPNLINDSLKIVKEYYNLFPSAHIRYDLKKKQELSLSYSKRINRPRSGTLNPFVNYSDPLNLRLGNPYLTPEYINSFDLGYSKESKKVNFTTSIYYRFTTDVIQRVKLFYDNNGTATTWGNIDESQSYGVEVVLNVKPTKWWKNTLSINGNQIEYTNTLGESNFSNSGVNFNFKYSGTVDFWKGTASFQVNVRYNTPRITAQGKVLPRSVMDLSASKKINDHWTISTRLSDVFNTQGFRYDLGQEDVRQKGEYKWLTRRFYLTIAYKFGKLEMSGKPNRGGGESGGGVDF